MFEREREDGFDLCSVTGVYRLAKAVPVQDAAVAAAFAKRHGTTPSADWVRDVDNVLSRQRPLVRAHMKAIKRVRDTRLAHIQQLAPETRLPGIAAFEKLLAFAFDFRSLVNEAFLNVHPHPTPERQTGRGQPAARPEDGWSH